VRLAAAFLAAGAFFAAGFRAVFGFFALSSGCVVVSERRRRPPGLLDLLLDHRLFAPFG
jgi:hypothetical protein